MGINNGKFYDAKHSLDYYDFLNNSKSKYDSSAEITRLAHNDFDNNPLFKGMTATALKRFIKFGSGKMLNDTTNMHDMMISDQRYLMNAFVRIVDSSPDARVEFDTLEKINNDFKCFYRRFSDIANETKGIMDRLNQEFGGEVSGGFPYPNSKCVLDSHIDMCGGDATDKGFFKECQNNLLEFDNEMKSYLRGRETPFNSADLNKRIKAVSDIIYSYHYDNPKINNIKIDILDNPNIKTVKVLEKRLDMFCNNVDHYFEDKGNEIGLTMPGLARNCSGTFLCSFSAIEAAKDAIAKKVISLPFYNSIKRYITENTKKHPGDMEAYRITPMEAAIAFEVGGAMKSYMEKGNLSELRENAKAFYDDFQQGGVNYMVDCVAGTSTLPGVSNMYGSKNLMASASVDAMNNTGLPFASEISGLFNPNAMAEGINVRITNLWNNLTKVVSGHGGGAALSNYFQTAGYVSVYGASFFYCNSIEDKKKASNAKTTNEDYTELQKQCGFTGGEMDFLKKYYPDQLKSLDGVRRFDTNEAMIIADELHGKYSRYKKNENKYNEISDSFVRDYAIKHDLNAEQISNISNIEKVQNHDEYDYSGKIKDMQIVATTLLSEGHSISFVAGMLGNVYIEGEVGKLENVNQGTNTKYEYWNQINKVSYVDEETGKTYTYYDDFRDKHIYEVDFQVYKRLVELDMIDKEDGDNVIGCGSIQWTLKGRFSRLLDCYEEADRMGNNDGQLSYEECVVAESNCMVMELGVDEPGYRFNTRVVKACSTDDSEVSAKEAAKIICDIYENPSDDAKKLEERQTAAGDLYNAMIQ